MTPRSIFDHHSSEIADLPKARNAQSAQFHDSFFFPTVKRARSVWLAFSENEMLAIVSDDAVSTTARHEHAGTQQKTVT